jgi:hypothetical protein
MAWSSLKTSTGKPLEEAITSFLGNDLMNHRFIERAFWGSTGLFAMFMIVGGICDLLHVRPFVEDIRRLGYPEYLLTLLGFARLVGVAVLLYPGIPTLKEWSYAGFTFNLTGASIAQIVSGSSMLQILPPVFCGMLLAVSYGTYRALSRSTESRRAAAV